MGYVNKYGRGMSCSGCISVLDNALRWLQNLKGRKEQWAARYTWRHPTLGVHSTQRSEQYILLSNAFLPHTHF